MGFSRETAYLYSENCSLNTENVSREMANLNTVNVPRETAFLITENKHNFVIATPEHAGTVS